MSFSDYGSGRCAAVTPALSRVANLETKLRMGSGPADEKTGAPH